MFGQPSKNQRAATAAELDAQANQSTRQAREARKQAATHRAALDNQTSTDRGADRYAARKADQDAATDEYNARGLRQAAKATRRGILGR